MFYAHIKKAACLKKGLASVAAATCLILLAGCAQECSDAADTRAIAIAAKKQSDQAYGVALQALEQSENASDKANGIVHLPKTKKQLQ